MLLVDGNYTQWSKWSPCDSETFDTKRTRTCQGYQHGGKCEGESVEIRKCGKKYDPILAWPGIAGMHCMGTSEFNGGGNTVLD